MTQHFSTAPLAALAALQADDRSPALGATTSPRLEAFGEAWMRNMELQQTGGEEFDRASDSAAEEAISERLDALVDEECELSRAIRQEPALTKADLAFKARVVLREINSFSSNARFYPEDVVPPVDQWERLGVSLAEGIAASLALDLIRLAAEGADRSTTGGAHA